MDKPVENREAQEVTADQRTQPNASSPLLAANRLPLASSQPRALAHSNTPILHFITCQGALPKFA